MIIQDTWSTSGAMIWRHFYSIETQTLVSKARIKWWLSNIQPLTIKNKHTSRKQVKLLRYLPANRAVGSLEPLTNTTENISISTQCERDVTKPLLYTHHHVAKQWLSPSRVSAWAIISRSSLADLLRCWKICLAEKQRKIFFRYNLAKFLTTIPMWRTWQMRLGWGPIRV